MSKPTPPNPSPQSKADQPRVAIVGWGLVTPLGEGAWPTFRALLAGRTLADRAGELPQDTAPLDLARALGCVGSVQHNRADPAVSLAERAVREAAMMAGQAPAGLPLWLGTSKGAIARLSNAMGLGRPIDDDTARCVALGPHAYMADQLARRLHTINRTHHVAACSSGLFALDAARRELLQPSPATPARSQAPTLAMVASADAAITPALVASYQRLGVLGEVNADRYRQRPLDANRSGFMLSEMGVAVLLQRIEPGQPMPERAVELLDTQTATEPFDMIRSPETMLGIQAIWKRISSRWRVDMVHPHAPGTREHDPAELGVLLQPPNPAGHAHPTHPAPDIYAVKGAIGHGLGASGLASLVISAMCLTTGRRPPMPWLSDPMSLPDGQPINIDPATIPCDRSGIHAVFAAGFGGHLAAATVRGGGPRRGA